MHRIEKQSSTISDNVLMQMDLSFDGKRLGRYWICKLPGSVSPGEDVLFLDQTRVEEDGEALLV
jgi:hypothetical protein